MIVPDLVFFGLLGAAFGWLVRYVRYLNRPKSLTDQTSIWVYIFVGTVFGLGVGYLVWRTSWEIPNLEWIFVAVLGAAVGIGELTSRYPDAPLKAVLSLPAAIYVCMNMLAAVAALAIGDNLGWFTVSANDNDGVAWSNVIVAGLGAMALLRSSVFQVRVSEDKDVGVGPVTFLQAVLDAADRAVDRLRAQERAWAVARVMERVSPDKAMDILPGYISALMQNLSTEEQGEFEERVGKLRDNKSYSEQVKALTLGLLAMKYTGEQVLGAAVQSLANEVLRAAEGSHDAAQKTMEKASETKEATEKAATLAAKVTEAAQRSDAPLVVKTAVEEVSEAAEAAKRAAMDTADKSETSVKAAEETLNVASQVQESGGRATEIPR